MAGTWRKNTAARNMSGSALSPSCTSFLFLDQKIKAEGKELPHASHSRGLAASSALALWCSRRTRGKPIPGRVPWHHPAPQLCQPQRLPRGAPRGPAAILADQGAWCPLPCSYLAKKGWPLLRSGLFWAPAWHGALRSLLQPGGDIYRPYRREDHHAVTCTGTEAPRCSASGSSHPTSIPACAAPKNPHPQRGWSQQSPGGRGTGTEPSMGTPQAGRVPGSPQGGWGRAVVAVAGAQPAPW